MSIDPCLEQGVFEPEATTAMGEAFEAACEELHDGGRLPMVREVVALRIIAAARSGELNTDGGAKLDYRHPNVVRSFALRDYKPQATKAPLAPAGFPLDPVDSLSGQADISGNLSDAPRFLPQHVAHLIELFAREARLAPDVRAQAWWSAPCLRGSWRPCLVSTAILFA